MRTLNGLNRRSFLIRTFAFCVAFVQGWWSRPGTARAEPDYFTGTDFVGKTRVGIFDLHNGFGTFITVFERHDDAQGKPVFIGQGATVHLGD